QLLSLCTIRTVTTTTRFPYTTLFRSYPHIAKRVADEGHEIANHSITHANLNTATKDRIIEELTVSQQQIETATGVRPETFRPPRSEEHTSELQSRFDLVCRLLLEKKN